MSGLAYSENKAEAFQVMLLVEEARQHQVGFTNSSEYSANLDEGTSIVELFSDQDCWVRLVRSTSDAVAVAESTDRVKAPSVFVPGGITKFFGIMRIEGVLWKLAVVRDTASGTLRITEGG